MHTLVHIHTHLLLHTPYAQDIILNMYALDDQSGRVRNVILNSTLMYEYEYSHEWRHATMSISLEILFELTSDHVSSVTALPPWPRLSDKLFHFSQRC